MNKMQVKLTKENWEKEFDRWLVDWNDRQHFENRDDPVRDVKYFIKQLLDEVDELKRLEEIA